MSAPRLREALASLLRDRRDASASLTRDAERAISRRVTRRWGAGALAVTAAGALTFVGGTALLSATDAAEPTASAAPSPTASEPVTMAVAHIPLSGGPEFAQPDDAYLCGDLAPESLATEQDLALALALSRQTDADSAASPQAANLSVDLTYLGTGDAGTGSVGSITLLLVRDGRIAGAIENVDSELSWPLQPGSSIQTGAGVFTDFFTCKRRSAEGQHRFFNTTVASGEYDVVAVAKVFSTEESVALGQAVPPQYHLDESLKDPGGIYVPGSYDCTQLLANGAMARGCLPDVATTALLDNTGESISVMYDSSALVDPFETTLVSSPVRISLIAWSETPDGQDIQYRYPEDFLRFESVGDVVCGATVNDLYFSTDRANGVEVWSSLPDLWSLTSGTYEAQVMPWLAPNGSSLRLEDGARIAYLQQREPTDANSPLPVYDVVGFAPVELAGILLYDRYTGPTTVPLAVGVPEPCPNASADSDRLTEAPLLVGTWVVTAPNGAQTRHDVVATANSYSGYVTFGQ